MRSYYWIAQAAGALFSTMSMAAKPKPAAGPTAQEKQNQAANKAATKNPGIQTPENIQKAIDQAIAYLYSQQNNGTWETSDGPGNDPNANANRANPATGQFGGYTALAVYALLSAGEKPTDPKLAPAIEFLKRANMVGVYAIGLRCQVWHILYDAEDPSNRAQHDDLASYLERDRSLLNSASRSNTTMYSYIASAGGDDFDHSVSQHGVLGMWALQESGREVGFGYWDRTQTAWQDAQDSDGGWCYARNPNNPSDLASTLPMTAAGIASLYLAQDEMLAGTVSGCHGKSQSKYIQTGLAWMGTHFEDVFSLPNDRLYYTLYGMERIGVASGSHLFETTNWYDRGADFLVRRQTPDGSWGDAMKDTCFGLLFLVRSRASLTINKLQYFNHVNGNPVEGDWNERPRDVQNFNSWFARQTELDQSLNWQVVTLDGSDKELHSAPLLLVAGDEPLLLSNKDQQKLKHYLDLGGTVLFNADCGSVAFTKSVMQLGTKLYPHSEFRPLTPDHPIFHHEMFRLASAAGDVPKVFGLSNGIRELMVLVPQADVSCYWQAGRKQANGVGFKLGCNILMYASDKIGIQRQGATYLVDRDPKISAESSIKVARLNYNGTWDPEPYAWVRMAAIMHNRDKIDLDVHGVKLGGGALSDYKVAVLTGTGSAHISDAGWAEIQQFVKNGGTLIVDNAGGAADSVFASEAAARLSAFDGAADQLHIPIPTSDPFYSSTGPALGDVHYRSFSRGTVRDMSSPDIRGIKYNDRIGVFYSSEDLTGGLVGQHVDGVVGYEPETAAVLVEKMLLYAEKQ